jgi:hypothetical protein
MEHDIEQAIAHGADGVVFGALDERGALDEGACRRLLIRAGGKQAVFHRAWTGAHHRPGLSTDPHDGPTRETGCDQIHIASYVRRTDPSARGNPEVYFGSALYPSEDSYEAIDRSFVAAVRGVTAVSSP